MKSEVRIPKSEELSLVPEWRSAARAGISLAAARAGEGVQSPKSNVQSLTAEVRRPNAGLPAELGRIIRPEVQPRWLLPSLSMVTPQYLETILRGAMLGNHVFQWQLFDMMEDTWPRLVKNLNELKECSITELREKWRLEAWRKRNEAAEAEAEEKAAVVEEALFEMPGDAALNENDFEDTCYDILDGWAKGVSLLELEWEARATSELGTILAPRSTYWVHPRNYAWDSAGNLGLAINDGPGGERAMAGHFRTDQRMSEAGGLVPLVEDKFIVAIHRSKTGHPLGGALLRALAWWWCASNFSADWLLNYAQIFGIPIRWTTYAPGVPQETVDKICEMLANMGSQGWGAFPAGTALELKEASHGSGELPQANVLDRADQQCDLLILGQTLTTSHGSGGSGSGGGSGSRALGEVHERVRGDRVHAAAKFLARTLNRQVIPAICRLNYDNDLEVPSLVPNEEEPEAALANAQVLDMAIKDGIPVPVNFALEKLNIPRAEKGEEVVTVPEPAGAGAGNPKTENRDPKENRSPKSEVRSPNGSDGSDEEKMEATARGTSLTVTAHEAATERLTNHVLESLTGVEAKWLGNVKPVFRRLCAAASSTKVTDAEFVQVIEKAQREMPELFNKLDGRAVAEALEGAMGAAAVNGASRGFMDRSPKSKVQSPKSGAR